MADTSLLDLLQLLENTMPAKIQIELTIDWLWLALVGFLMWKAPK